MQYWYYLELDRLSSLINDDDSDHYHFYINLFVGMSNRKSEAAVDRYGIPMGLCEQKNVDSYYGHWRNVA